MHLTSNGNMTCFYFKHDFDASRDSKIIKLRQAYGWEGYGVFWALLEILASNEHHHLETDYNALAWSLRADAEMLKHLVEDFELFAFTEDRGTFYSKRMITQLESLDELRKKRSEAGKKGNAKRWKNHEVVANAIEIDRTCLANATESDRRIEKNRIDSINGNQTLSQEINTNNTPCTIGVEQNNLLSANAFEEVDKSLFGGNTIEQKQTTLSGFALTLNDNSLYSVPLGDLNMYKDTFPAVDVEQELREMESWGQANPTKRKTRRGIKSFIHKWLSDEQDKPHRPVLFKSNQNQIKRVPTFDRKVIGKPTDSDIPF